MKKYNLKKDHTEIKKQIKEWENRLDNIVGSLLVYESHKEDYCNLGDLREEIENVSHEMMTINL